MRRRLPLALILCTACAHTSAVTKGVGRCGPALPGIEALVGAPLVVLGEIHGVDAAPQLTADIACQLSERAPLTLALELPRQEKAALDTFLASAGEPADRAALLATPFWRDRWQDGRASRARFELLDAVRRMQKRGAPIRVVPFDDKSVESDQAARERAMAERIWEEHKPEQATLVLVGNLHARTVPGAPWDPSVVWMSTLLAQKEPRIVTLDNRYPTGSAWVCFSPHECGVHEMKGQGSGPRRIERFARRSAEGYDGVWQLGPIAASLPATSIK